MIKRSFKCCGISNDINRLEDDLIFDLSKLENVNNRNRGVEEENTLFQNLNEIFRDENDKLLSENESLKKETAK